MGWWCFVSVDGVSVSNADARKTALEKSFADEQVTVQKTCLDTIGKHAFCMRTQALKQKQTDADTNIITETVTDADATRHGCMHRNRHGCIHRNKLRHRYGHRCTCII